jgi:hypothetical protein
LREIASFFAARLYFSRLSQLCCRNESWNGARTIPRARGMGRWSLLNRSCQMKYWEIIADKLSKVMTVAFS